MPTIVPTTQGLLQFVEDNAASEIVKFKSRDEWLKSRREWMGSDDVASLYGVGYASEFDTWRRFTYPDTIDDVEERDNEASEAMFWGSQLQTGILEGLAEREGWVVAEWPQNWRIKLDERVACTPDAIAMEELASEAEAFVVEVKCFSEFAEKSWPRDENGLAEMPARYQVQGQLQLAATGLKRGVFAVLFGGRRLELIEFERNDAFIADLVASVREFWRLVDEEEEPEIDGSDETTRSIFALYPEDQGYATELPQGFDVVADEFESVKASLKKLEKKKQELRNKLVNALGEASYGVTPDGHAYSCKLQETTRVDSGRLKGEFPEVFEQCKKIGKSRVLRSVKKVPNEVDWIDFEKRG